MLEVSSRWTVWRYYTSLVYTYLPEPADHVILLNYFYGSGDEGKSVYLLYTYTVHRHLPVPIRGVVIFEAMRVKHQCLLHADPI